MPSPNESKLKNNADAPARDRRKIRGSREGKSKSEMEGRDLKVLKCTSTSSSSTSNLCLDSLPIETVEEILTRIPAQDIVDATMFVCRKWYHIIRTKNFVIANLHHSTPGLLIRNMFKRTSSFMYLTQAGQIVISNFKYHFRNIFWSSCNGLVLDSDPADINQLIITNPLTNQHFHLPPFFPSTEQPFGVSATSYVATRMEYKVVRTYSLGMKLYTPRTQLYCAILTVGVDNSWRLVDTQHLSIPTRQLFHNTPVVTGGFVHWADHLNCTRYLRFNKNYVLTLNMETEIITRVTPPLCDGGYYYYKYLSSGKSNLSLLIDRGHLKWDVWEMDPETVKWTKLPDIDLEARKDLLNQLYDREEGHNKLGAGRSLDCRPTPVGWLKYQEVIVFIVYRSARDKGFRQARLRIVYNLKKQDITLFSLDYNCSPYTNHMNSLIGC